MSVNGDLSDLSLGTLIKMICLEGRHSVLKVKHTDDELGALAFADGELLHAAVGVLAGDKALIHMLVWETGAFRLDHRPVDTTLRTVKTSWERLAERMPPRRIPIAAPASISKPTVTIPLVDRLPPQHEAAINQPTTIPPPPVAPSHTAPPQRREPIVFAPQANNAPPPLESTAFTAAAYGNGRGGATGRSHPPTGNLPAAHVTPQIDTPISHTGMLSRGPGGGEDRERAYYMGHMLAQLAIQREELATEPYRWEPYRSFELLTAMINDTLILTNKAVRDNRRKISLKAILNKAMQTHPGTRLLAVQKGQLWSKPAADVLRRHTGSKSELQRLFDDINAGLLHILRTEMLIVLSLFESSDLKEQWNGKLNEFIKSVHPVLNNIRAAL